MPAAIIETEIAALAAILPLERHPRILDIGCGIGRITGPLSSLGYAVTGIDISVAALLSAKSRVPAARYVALDQEHIGRMRWQFDGALFMWNSLGFVGRGADLETLAGVARVLRPGGSVVLDLYHPDWLRQNERSGEPDRGAVSVRRWMRGSRCFHEIRYDNGRVDDIQFDVYQRGTPPGGTPHPQCHPLLLQTCHDDAHQLKLDAHGNQAAIGPTAAD